MSAHPTPKQKLENSSVVRFFTVILVTPPRFDRHITAACLVVTPHNPMCRSGCPLDLLHFRPKRLEHFTPERPVNAARRGVVGMKLTQNKGTAAVKPVIVFTPGRSGCLEAL